MHSTFLELDDGTFVRAESIIKLADQGRRAPDEYDPDGKDLGTMIWLTSSPPVLCAWMNPIEILEAMHSADEQTMYLDRPVIEDALERRRKRKREEKARSRERAQAAKSQADSA